MDKRICVFNFLEALLQSETLLVYLAKSVVNDPDEGTTVDTLLNPIPVKAVVNQLGMSTLKWKYWGNLPTGSIEILTDLKNYDLLLIAKKITYQGNDYNVYQNDAKGFSMIKRHDYLMAILERTNV
jgi:hypothetical protein